MILVVFALAVIAVDRFDHQRVTEFLNQHLSTSSTVLTHRAPRYGLAALQ